MTAVAAMPSRVPFLTKNHATVKTTDATAAKGQLVTATKNQIIVIAIDIMIGGRPLRAIPRTSV